MHEIRAFDQSSPAGMYFLRSRPSTAQIVASTLALVSLFAVSLLSYLHRLPTVQLANGEYDTGALPPPVELYRRPLVRHVRVDPVPGDLPLRDDRRPPLGLAERAVREGELLSAPGPGPNGLPALHHLRSCQGVPGRSGGHAALPAHLGGVPEHEVLRGRRRHRRVPVRQPVRTGRSIEDRWALRPCLPFPAWAIFADGAHESLLRLRSRRRVPCRTRGAGPGLLPRRRAGHALGVRPWGPHDGRSGNRRGEPPMRVVTGSEAVRRELSAQCGWVRIHAHYVNQRCKFRLL
jgi:hypothetical protein